MVKKWLVASLVRETRAEVKKDQEVVVEEALELARPLGVGELQFLAIGHAGLGGWGL